MKKKLIIVGCSWGCGEWRINNRILELAHPGLTEYLSTDFNVVNLSRCGASNWQSCFVLRNYLHHVNNSDLCDIVVLQTDVARTACSEVYQVDYDYLYSHSSNLSDFYQKTLEIFYIKLNELAQEYNLKIHLVGGLSDLNTDVISLYSNLDVICNSWITLLDSTHTPDVVPLILNPSLLTKIKQHNNVELFEEVIQYSDRQFLKAQTLMETDYFGPGFGDFHPNRKAHEILAKHIKNFFNKELQ